MAGNRIVRTCLKTHVRGHCGETSAYKTTGWRLLCPYLNKWYVFMWSLELCNGLWEASAYKVTWLHRLIFVINKCQSTIGTRFLYAYLDTIFSSFAILPVMLVEFFVTRVRIISIAAVALFALMKCWMLKFRIDGSITSEVLYITIWYIDALNTLYVHYSITKCTIHGTPNQNLPN